MTAAAAVVGARVASARRATTSGREGAWRRARVNGAPRRGRGGATTRAVEAGEEGSRDGDGDGAQRARARAREDEGGEERGQGWARGAAGDDARGV